MGRLMAIDLGKKRCGIAVTDSLRLAGTPLATVATGQLTAFVQDYVKREQVDAIIAGEPRTLSGEPSESTRWIEPALQRLRKAIPTIKIIRYDERFTSTLAHRAMIDGGMKRMARRDKAAVDQISAAIILNDYLNSAQCSMQS